MNEKVEVVGVGEVRALSQINVVKIDMGVMLHLKKKGVVVLTRYEKEEVVVVGVEVEVEVKHHK